jgi:putative drug exporter of the RND superfamily
MARQPNLAASMGGWSARHRVIAIVGWLLFVAIATMAGSAAGQVTMTQAEYGAGESGRATWMLTNAGVAQPAQELVMVHSATATAGTPGFRAAVHAVLSGIEATGRVQDVRAPTISKDARSELIQFAIKGDPNTAANLVSWSWTRWPGPGRHIRP